MAASNEDLAADIILPGVVHRIGSHGLGFDCDRLSLSAEKLLLRHGTRQTPGNLQLSCRLPTCTSRGILFFVLHQAGRRVQSILWRPFWLMILVDCCIHYCSKHDGNLLWYATFGRSFGRLRTACEAPAIARSLGTSTKFSTQACFQFLCHSSSLPLPRTLIKPSSNNEKVASESLGTS
jgi:hypothetical protein